MTLVVAGDVKPDEIKVALDRALGGWKTAARKPARSQVVAATAATRLLVVDRPGAEQSDVRIGLVVPLKRTDQRSTTFDVLCNVVGVGISSRLMQKLREELGYTNGAWVAMEWFGERGRFVIYTDLFTPKTAPGIKEALAIVSALAEKDVPEDELRKAKQHLIRALPAGYATNAAAARAFAGLALYNLPDDWHQRYAAEVRKVTAKQVKAMSRQILPAKRLVVVVVGDLAKVRAELEQLGLGAPRSFDPDGMPRPLR